MTINLDQYASRRHRLDAIPLPNSRDRVHFDVRPAANPLFRVAMESGKAEITVFAEIGGPAGVTAENINNSLTQLGARDVVVKINSPGGDAFEGVAIYNLLRAHPGRVTAQVLGISASAASIITMAADRIEMARNSQLMIHNVWTGAVGNADFFRQIADELDRLDAAMADTYVLRTGQPLSKVIDLMDAETYMTSDDAIRMRFADALLDADAQPALKTRSTPESRREMELFLRNSGFSKAAAAKITAGGWSALAGRTPDALETQQFADRLSAAAEEVRRNR